MQPLSCWHQLSCQSVRWSCLPPPVLLRCHQHVLPLGLQAIQEHNQAALTEAVGEEERREWLGQALSRPAADPQGLADFLLGASRSGLPLGASFYGCMQQHCEVGGWRWCGLTPVAALGQANSIQLARADLVGLPRMPCPRAAGHHSGAAAASCAAGPHVHQNAGGDAGGGGKPRLLCHIAWLQRLGQGRYFAHGQGNECMSL